MTLIRNRLIHLQPRTADHISRARTVLSMGHDGFIHDGPEVGLFSYETRVVSRYAWSIDGQAPQPVALSPVEQHSWLGYYIVLPPGVEAGDSDHGSGMMRPETEQTLELRLSRSMADGMHEDVDLTNYSQQPTRFRLTLEIDADFLGMEETRQGRQQRGRRQVEWHAGPKGGGSLVFDYHAEHRYDHQGNVGTAAIHRGLTVRFLRCDSPPAYEEGRIGFEVSLEPRESWHACVELVPRIEDRPMEVLHDCHTFLGGRTEYDRRQTLFLNEGTTFHSPETQTLTPVVVGTLEQARRDLAALRLYDMDTDERAWTMAAGLPIYVALFGRDMLTAAWQGSLIGPEMLRGTLPVLADTQGTAINDWRDEQPGRMIHEMHAGPLSALNFVPHGRYYGSDTSSVFYPVAVAQLWHWTGKREWIEPLIKPAVKALRWTDTYGDLDGDGFYEYQTRSEQGVKNQSWKDSPDAIVYEDGSQVSTPIATCETQAFVYGAKRHLAEMLWWLGRTDEAKTLYQQAEELKRRFNDVFWIEDEHFYALGLDPDKRPIRSIASNPGHCIAAGIADESRVPPTVARLMSGDLFSGWGVRTLSAQHPAFNPFSYHRGSVWPVSQGTFALGFYRFGLHGFVEQLCRSLFEAAALFEYYRLPEVFSGHPRDDDHPFPAFYPQANAPQAWSASTVFLALESMLGLYPYAPLNMLLVDPHLPDWLPEITVADLRVGDATVTLRFCRTPDGRSDYHIEDLRGPLHVLRQPSPWSLTAGYGERLKDALTSLLPGHHI